MAIGRTRLLSPGYAMINRPVDAGMNRYIYIESQLAPTLKQDIVILDNLPAHKSDALRKRGAWFCSYREPH